MSEQMWAHELIRYSLKTGLMAENAIGPRVLATVISTR